jgi:TonB-dependent SusC/RagA subfamily outer membrane receptor
VSLRVGLLAVLAASCSHKTGTTGHPAPVRQEEVTSDDIARAPTQSIEQQLMAKVSGITVSRTSSGSLAIRIRGVSSLNGNNSPLYVVDGLAVEAGPEGELPGINPYDIESIKVLKDTEAMTLYGSRGANGVIIINTKLSNKRQKNR